MMEGTSEDDNEGSWGDLEMEGGEMSKISRGLLNMMACFVIFYIILGISGNLLTIVSLLRCSRMRNVTAAFIISLCVADLVFSLIVLPLEASRFIHGTWVHSDAMCVFFPLVRYTNVGVSLLSIAAITINRYIMIAHHNLYSQVYTKINIGIMIAFCWSLSFGLLLPTLAGAWGEFGYNPHLGTCTILRKDGKSPKEALFIVGFLIPCVIIVLCYARIFWIVHKSETRMREHARKISSASAHDKDIRRKRNEWKITKMVLVIFVSFVTCYLPITLVKVADPHVNFPGLHIIGYLLIYASCCVNPLIYVIMNKQYRQAYKMTLYCKESSRLSVSDTVAIRNDTRRGNPRTLVSAVSFGGASMAPSSENNSVHPSEETMKLEETHPNS